MELQLYTFYNYIVSVVAEFEGDSKAFEFRIWNNLRLQAACIIESQSEQRKTF